MPAGKDRSRAIAKVVLFATVVRVVAWFVTSPDARAPEDQLFASTFLLLASGALYFFSTAILAAKRSVPYFGVQLTLALAIGMFAVSLWLTLALIAALGSQLVAQIAALFRRRRRRA